MLVLARILYPEHFGLFAMATVFTSLSTVLAELGTGDAVIRSQHTTDKFLSSIFWVNVFISLVVCCVLSFAAPAIALHYDEPLVEYLIYVLLADVLLSGIGRIYQAMLERELSFKRLAACRLSAQLLGSVVGIVSALAGGGVWSLVAAQIGSNFLYIILLFNNQTWRPHWHFATADVRTVIGFSGYLSLVRLFDHLQAQAVIYLVAANLGREPAGVYTQSQKLARKPTQSIAGFLMPVLYPTMTAMVNEGNSKTLPRIFLDASQGLAVVYAPVGVLLLCFSDLIIDVLLGPRWTGAVPVVAAIGPMVFFTALTKLNVTYLKSLGRVPHVFWIYLLYFFMTVAVVAFSVPYGLGVVATSVAACSAMVFLLTTVAALSAARLSLINYLVNARYVSIYTAAMLGAIFLYALLPGDALFESTKFTSIVGAVLSVFCYCIVAVAKPAPPVVKMLKGLTGTERKSNV